MKKIMMFALSLMLILGLCISASAAEESHPHTGDHCVCGGAAVGVGDHTECTDIEWTPLSEALKAVGRTMSTADFGKLPSGNYYLDGDVVVTGANSIGSKADSLTTEPSRVVELTICLNGYNITRSEDKGKIFGYMHMNSTLNICDCSYDGSTFGGTVAGGSNNYGSVIYTYSKSTLNIYGGNFTGKGYTNGGTIVVACDGCGDLDGNDKYEEADRGKSEPSVMNLYNGHISGSSVTATGGTIQLFHPANLNIYGGTVVGGTAGKNGGAIAGGQGTITITGGNIIGGTAANAGGAVYSSSGKIYITGGTMTGGTNTSGLEVVQVIQNDGKLLGTYTTFAEGLAKAQDVTNCYLRLLNDLETTDTVSGTLYLDLNGHTLKGINITGTLYGMDCTTNAYDDSAAGSLIPASGKPQTQVKTTVAQTGAVRRYLALESEGSYSFHRFYLGITKVTLKPGTVGMGYKATFAGGEKIAAALTPSLGFGYKMWLTDGAVISRGYSADRFEKTQELTLRIDNFLDADITAEENAKRAEMDVHAVAYLRFADGTEITSTEVCYDLRQMVELADNVFTSYNATKRNALTSLSARFSQVMLGWDIENTHHAIGSIWEQVDSAAFLEKLTLRSGSTNYYNLAAGSYVLTEDIDLGDKRLCVNSGKTVSICLNGHTITTSNRLFEQYGTLNICDCHEFENEGTMLSTLAGESKTYSPIGYCRYNSVTNLYGGNLKASGKVTAAGVLALSHDGSAHTDKPAAVMNMYGGTVSGGQTYTNGGLISIWNNATFNMYGGELYGGSAEGRGGGIDINYGTLSILGGSIYGNTAGTSGGGIFTEGTSVKINISGATIADNTAANNGGNLHLGKGTYSIADTTITGGQATEGGGIKIYSCQAKLSNVTLKNNTARTLGGAIHASGTTLEMEISGGQITGNTAAELGDGIYAAKGSLSLAGDVRITDNTADNLYVEFYASVNADGLTEGANVSITPEAMTVLGTNKEAVPYICCDDSTYTAKYAYGNVLLFKNGLTPASAVSGFQVGFGESNITPATDGIPLAGYSNPSERLSVNDDTRNPDYDDIKAQSVAITDENGTTVILIFADLIRSDAYVFDYIVDAVAAATGVPEEHIFLNMSHSHSVPSVNSTTLPAIVEYNKTLPNLFAQSALQAMNDRAPATMETGSFEVQQTINGKTQYYNFYRHYSYEEDGIVKYFGDQFGTATYNSTTKPVRDADHTMHLVRFVRDGKDILMSNWRIHPHFEGSETDLKLTADAIGTIRYYMAQLLPDTHYIYFQGAAGNMNETSRLTTKRVGEANAQNHDLGYVAYGEAVAQIIVDNLGCLESAETGLLQVDHYDYLAKADNPSDEEYKKAKAVYDIFKVETAGMSLSQQNAWVRDYCAENPEYNYISAFQLSFIVNRRYSQKDTVLPLNVVSLGKSFALFTGPFEMWDSISMEVEEKSPFKTTFCLGYSMDHQHYLVYYPEYLDQEDGVPYISYESENRHFTAPDTVLEMIEYWTEALNRLYNN